MCAGGLVVPLVRPEEIHRCGRNQFGIASGGNGLSGDFVEVESHSQFSKFMSGIAQSGRTLAGAVLYASYEISLSDCPDCSRQATPGCGYTSTVNVPVR